MAESIAAVRGGHCRCGLPRRPQASQIRRTMRRCRLAYLVSHPIQYQAPLLRRIAAEPDIELTVLFESDHSLHEHVDREFGRTIAWDVKLLDGYRHRFLQPLPFARINGGATFWRPLSGDLASTLRAGAYDALWVHGYARANHLAALALAKRLGMRTLLRDETTQSGRERSTLRMIAKRAAFRLIDRIVDRYLAVGSSNAQHWRDLGLNPGKIVLMPYAVDGRLFGDATPQEVHDVRARFGIPEDQPVILFSAKLIARKRPHDMIEAVARLQHGDGPQPALVMAGDGDLAVAVRDRATSLGLRHVHLPGFQTQSQLAGLYRAADILVLPSQWETWGLVVNEAMNGGCAIVASDRVGAAADLVRDNGIVYPVGDVGALADALRRILGDRLLLERMRSRSRDIIAAWSFEEDVSALRQALELPAR
ncbi:MAG: glycosyltransferase family 4 protein [Reyranellaceae bacterium]